MKSLLRWGTTFGAIGGTVLTSLLSFNLSAIALPEAAVSQKLTPIPVFTVADAQGSPLVASTNDNQKVAGVFMSRQDAEQFVTKLKTENAELGNQVSVVPVSLKDIYDLDLENANQKDGLDFTYVPSKTEVDIAKTILTQEGKEYKGGVPLFVAKGGKEQGYLTVAQGDNQVIPFFFDKQQVESMIARFKEEQPDLAGTVTIEVAYLEGVLQALHSEDNELLTKLVLVPSTESLQFLQSLQQQNSNANKTSSSTNGSNPKNN